MPRHGFTPLPCATAGVAAVAARSSHSFARHSHDQYGIGAICDGGQRWHSGRVQVEAGPGETIAVNPGEVHDGDPIGDNGRAWKMLYFEPAIVTAAADEIFESRSGEFALARPVIGDRRATELVHRLFAAETRNVSTGLLREQILLALLAVVGRWTGGPADLPLPVALAKGRIDDDPTSALTLAELAAIAGVSRFQLLRAFVRATGFTPHAYLMQRRTDSARRLIAGGAPLAAAAAASGFADQSHMTRIFVRTYGMPPGALARALRPDLQSRSRL